MVVDQRREITSCVQTQYSETQPLKSEKWFTRPNRQSRMKRGFDCIKIEEHKKRVRRIRVRTYRIHYL